MRLRRKVLAAGATVAVLGALLAVVGTSPPARAALPQPPTGTQLTRFEIQGSPSGTYDWLQPYTSAAGTPIGYPTSGLLPFWSPTPDPGPFANPDPCGNVPDDSFVPGTKLDSLVIDDVTGLVDPDGNALKTGDLCNAYSAVETVNVPADPGNPAAGGQYHTVLYGAWQRNSDPGQLTFFIPLADQVAGNSAGDRMIEFDHDPNGTPTTAAYVRTWSGTAWVRTTTVLGPDVFQVATEAVASPSFGEFALDLTAIDILPEGGPCRVLQANYAFTQTDESNNATLKDYIGLDNPPLTNCGTLIVDKVATPTPSAPLSFGFQVDQTDGEVILDGGIAQVSSNLVVPGSPATYPATGDPVTIVDLLASPDYQVRETTLPPGWTQETLVCTGTDPFTNQPFAKTLYSSGSSGPDLGFPLGAGSTATCTVMNPGPPSVSLTKTVQPASAAGWSFEFTISPATDVTPSAAQTATSAAPTVTWENLTPGTPYTITETGVAGGYQAGAISCNGGGNTFTPVAGQVITCTATNQQLAQVTVVKSAAPANDELFNFGFQTGTGTIEPFQLRDPTAPTRVFADLVPGQTHAVVEVLTAGQVASTWSLASIGCLDTLDGTITTGTITGQVGEVMVTTKPGSRITCVFSNSQGASITIQKAANPAGTAQTFPFTVTGPPGAGLPTTPVLLDVNDDPTYSAAETFSSLPAGGYTVAEATPSGWSLVSFECTLQGAPFGTKDPVTGTVSFTLGADQDVVCAYQNTELGSITIGKTTLPAGGAGFDFTTTGLTPASFTLAHGGSQPFTGLLPGVYTVTEVAEPGWLLTDLVCTGATASTVTTDEATKAVSLTLAAGEDISCTYTNTQFGSVTVAKVTLPSTSTRQFLFTVAGVGPDLPDTGLVLANGGERTYPGLLPQTVTVTELLPVGWALTGGSCLSDIRGDLNLTGLQRGIPLLAGENVRCTYVNTELTSIVVVKQTEPAGSTQPFSFAASGGEPMAPSAFTLVDNPLPTAEFDPDFAQGFLVPPGTYSITELATAGWRASTGEAGTLTCSTPVAGSTVTLAGSTATFAVQPGDELVCEFLNKEVASLTVTKTVSQPAAVALPWSFDFTISPSAGVAPSATQTVSGTGSGTASVTWTGLDPDVTYTVTEAANTAYEQGAITCATNGAGATVDPVAGEDVPCMVTNRLRNADLGVEKNPPSQKAMPGAKVAFDLVVTNAGPDTAVNAAVTDIFPAALQSPTVVDPGPYSCDPPVGQVLTCRIAAHPVGVSATIEVEATLATSVTPGATYTNVVQVAADTPDPNLVNNQVSAVVIPLASLTVTKTVSQPAAVALPWSFDFTISPSAGVAPSATQTVSGTGSGTASVTWTGLDPDVTYTVTEAANTAYEQGAITCATNGTGASGSTVQPPPGANVRCTVTNRLRNADLEVVETPGNGTVSQGETAGFTPLPSTGSNPDSLVQAGLLLLGSGGLLVLLTLRRRRSAIG